MSKRRVIGITVAAIVVALGVAVGGILVSAGSNQDQYEQLKARVRQVGGDVEGIPKRRPMVSLLKELFPRDRVDGLVGFDGYELDVRDLDASSEKLRGLFVATPFKKVRAPKAKNLDDDWMARIPEPQAIQFMDLTGTAITDQSMDVIAKMQGLQGIYLVGTKVSDQGIERLIELPVLTSAFLGGPNLRRVRLEKLEFFDASGHPARKADEPVKAEGEIIVDGLPGTAELVSVSINQIPDPSPDAPAVDSIKDKYEVADLVGSTPGHFKFQVTFATLPAGSCKVLLNFKHRPKPRDLVIWYQLEGPNIRLETGSPTMANPDSARP